MKHQKTRKCPECKDTSNLQIDVDIIDGYVVRCMEPLGCGYEGKPSNNIRQALTNWNTRQELEI